MRCYVYRSRRRPGAYLYLPAPDDFSRVPEGLMRLFGRPEPALEFDLTPQRRLASEDPRQVLDNLATRGFHLQMRTENEQAF